MECSAEQKDRGPNPTDEKRDKPCRSAGGMRNKLGKHSKAKPASVESNFVSLSDGSAEYAVNEMVKAGSLQTARTTPRWFL